MDIDRQIMDMPMLFVTGASRSGTSMLSMMLGNNSKIAGLKELHGFGELVDPNKLHKPITKHEAIHLSRQLIARSKREIWGGIAREDGIEAEALWRDVCDTGIQVGYAVAKVMAYIASVKSKKIPCEQTPRNIFYARQLLEYYPNIRIVHIVRDPRDVLASQKNRWKRKKLGGSNIPYSEIIRVWFNYHPYTITKLWSRATRLAAELQAHEHFHVLRFEDIISDPEVELRKICDFLKISYEKEMLNIPHVGSSHAINTSAKSGVRQSSINRWKSCLSMGEVYICELLADAEMRTFAYAKSEITKPISLSLINQLLKYPIHAFGVLASNPRRAWIQLHALIGKSR